VTGVPEQNYVSFSDSILQKHIQSMQFACSKRNNAGLIKV